MGRIIFAGDFKMKQYVTVRGFKYKVIEPDRVFIERITIEIGREVKKQWRRCWMKILFVPFAEGGIGHIIPLLALILRLEGSQHKACLLLPGGYHKIVKHMDFDVLDIDYSESEGGLFKELAAFKAFKPDIVVDDASMTSLFSTRLDKKPRVAIQRTGMFPGARPRRKGQRYQFDKIISIDKYKGYGNAMGLSEIKSYTDFFDAEMKIVPGISSIEVLPVHLRSDPTYVFCGPLLLDDFFLGVDFRTKENAGAGKLYDYKPLEFFFNANKNRFKVLFTYGTVASPTELFLNVFKYLFDNNVAVVTTTNIPELNRSYRELCFYAKYLPMHYICANVDMIIHHCGSGTYQYQILHQLPSITLDTEFQDRIDVALRMEELGVNSHIPLPNEGEDFLPLFKQTFDKYVDPSHSSYYNTAKKKLFELKEEADRVSTAFDFESVLNRAVEQFSHQKGFGESQKLYEEIVL
jgi:hypothetical protein